MGIPQCVLWEFGMILDLLEMEIGVLEHSESFFRRVLLVIRKFPAIKIVVICGVYR